MRRDGGRGTGDRGQKTAGVVRGSASYRVLLAAWVGLTVATGCVHRSLTIRTDPPGAMVYLNDQLKGTSPVTYDFLWYGWYRLTLRKDGFERFDDHKLLDAPPHLWIPMDLAMEFLPFPVLDTRTWSYILKPLPPLPTPIPPPLTPQAKPEPEEAPSTEVTTDDHPSTTSPTPIPTSTAPSTASTSATTIPETMMPPTTTKTSTPSPTPPASTGHTTRQSNDGASP